MSIHIAAKPGEIAETVLLPGDPLRAKFVAENMLENAVCYTEVRGMYGYTGTYKGKRLSIQGTGMGIPSHCIYVNELIDSYGVKNLIRVGTAGSLQNNIELRDVVIAMSACTDSTINKQYFKGMDFAPTANFELLKKAYDIACNKKIDAKVGMIFSTDVFYNDSPEEWQMWARYGVLAVEMEAAGLYTIAAKKGVKALTILTISDHLVKKQACSAAERQSSFSKMMEIALDLA